MKTILNYESHFKMLFDSDGKTPFDRSQKESNIFVMKAYMEYLRDKIQDSIEDGESKSNSDLYHTLFSDTLLGHTLKSDSAWAL